MATPDAFALGGRQDNAELTGDDPVIAFAAEYKRLFAEYGRLDDEAPKIELGERPRVQYGWHYKGRDPETKQEIREPLYAYSEEDIREGLLPHCRGSNPPFPSAVQRLANLDAHEQRLISEWREKLRRFEEVKKSHRICDADAAGKGT